MLKSLQRNKPNLIPNFERDVYKRQVKDRAHFYVVWDHQQDSRPIYIADIKTAADESSYNVTQSTLDVYKRQVQPTRGLGSKPRGDRLLERGKPEVGT